MHFLTSQEQKLMRFFLDVNLAWQDNIVAQIHSSRIWRENSCSSYFVFFDVKKEEKAICTNLEIPLEVILGTVKIPPEHIVGSLHESPIVKPCTFLVPDDNAIGVRLHFQNGYLSELEVYSLSGQEVNIDLMLKMQSTYILYDEKLTIG